MKEGWEYKKLGDVIEHLRTGLNPRTHFKLNTPDAEGYYITVRELKGFSIEPDEKTDKVNSAAIKRINERSNLKIGDVLFSGTGTIGKTALVSELPENWNIKEGVYAMTPKHSELDSKYFIYYIGSEYFLRLVDDKAAGTGVRSIPMKELIKLPIPVPSLSEQQRIVDYLDSAFAKIDAMKANAEKSLNEAKALFQASLKEMLEPKEGWEEDTLSNCCIKAKNIKWGKDTPAHKYIDLSSVDRETSQIYNTIVVTPQDAPSRAKQIVTKGDIIFATTRPTLRRVALICENYDGEICSTGFCVLRPKNHLASKWIFYLLKADRFYNYIEPLQSGANYPAVTDSAVKGYVIPVPPLSEQQCIVATLDSLKSKVDRLQANYEKISQECDALKQAILRKVFE